MPAAKRKLALSNEIKSVLILEKGKNQNRNVEPWVQSKYSEMRSYHRSAASFMQTV